VNNTKKEFKSISNFKLNELGINLDNPVVETIDELKASPPTLVIAECVKTFKFNQNKYFNQELFEILCRNTFRDTSQIKIFMIILIFRIDSPEQYIMIKR